MLLSDPNKLSIGCLSTHDVSSGREDSLHLSALADMTTHAPIGVDLLVGVLLDLILGVTSGILVVLVSDALSSRTEEALHAIEIA